MACRYELAQQGSCRRGASCYFSHDLGFIPAVVGRPTTNLAPTAPAFTPGLANFDPLAAALPQIQDDRKDNRAFKPCKFYQTRGCTKGARCPYSHAETSHAAGTAIRVQANTDQHDVTDASENGGTLPLQEMTRSFDGLSVVFRAGAEVKRISLPQDFSTVNLNGLTSHISEGDILDLLGRLGFHMIKASIKLTPTTSGTTALVKVEDPKFANSIYDTLTPRLAREIGYPDVKVQIVPVKIDLGAATQRINCRTVICSWHKATVTVYLKYRDRERAERVHDNFNNGSHKLGGLQVQSREQPRMSQSRGRHGQFVSMWNVILSNVPAQVRKVDIERVLKMDRPKQFELDISAPSYSYGSEFTPEDLQAKLTRIGQLENLEYKLDAPGKRHKVIAIFRDESEAAKACETLNDTPLIGPVKLFVELNAIAKIKILTIIYDALERPLEQLKDKHSKIHFELYRNTDSAQRFTVLKLSGSNAADLSSAKGEMDVLLQGYVAEVDGRNIWHPSFAGPSGAQMLKEMEAKTSVLIVREPASSILRLFGLRPLCIHASEALAELVHSLTSKAQEIVLDTRTFAIAVNGAYSKIQSRLGIEKVSLDVSSKPKRMIIRGDEQDSKFARQILNQWSSGQAQQTDDDCPICWTAPERPITSRCGHTYCADCFENMCAAAVSAQEDCKVQCQGATGTCKETLSLNDLQDNLTSSAFEAVLRTSFKTYIRRRPDQFRSCPTTDCGQIYRPLNKEISASKPKPAPSQLCLKCLNSICLICHACHGRMSCTDYKYFSSGEAAAVERLKKELGIKDCPRCETAMEKTEGCNHMQCMGCNMHICWVCLRMFSESGSTYKHMTETHGGIGLDH